MSIASEISRLSSVRDDIFTSITNKGVTVPATATFSSCPALIDSITGGGGGSPTSLVNTAFTASGFFSGYRPFTATQNSVPVYDVVTGNYTTGVNNLTYYIEIPMEVLTGNITGYSLNFGIQTWSIGSNQNIQIIPNKNAIYDNTFITDYTNDNFQVSGQETPTLYVCQIDDEKFHSWWHSINQQSWIVTAYTGASFVLGFTNYSQSTAIGNYEQMTQTGTSLPYPTYPTTTTGYITNEISGKESFTGSTYKVPNIYVSGFKNVVYDDSPEGGAIAISPANINLTSFSSNMLKNNIKAKFSFALNSTAYSYTYGSVNSAYSGFEGI